MTRLLHLALLLTTLPLYAQPVGMGYYRVSDAKDMVVLSAGTVYLSGSAVTTCTPKAPATTCSVTGQAFVKKTEQPQSVVVTGADKVARRRIVPPVVPIALPCPAGMVQEGHGPACRVTK